LASRAAGVASRMKLLVPPRYPIEFSAFDSEYKAILRSKRKHGAGHCQEAGRCRRSSQASYAWSTLIRRFSRTWRLGELRLCRWARCRDGGREAHEAPHWDPSQIERQAIRSCSGICDRSSVTMPYRLAPPRGAPVSAAAPAATVDRIRRHLVPCGAAPLPWTAFRLSPGAGAWPRSSASPSLSARRRSSRGSGCSGCEGREMSTPGSRADVLFVGATRPPMRWGVTYSALLLNGKADQFAHPFRGSICFKEFLL
jgi:hypothetical protein